MLIDRAGWPFIGVALVLAVGVGLVVRPRVVGAVSGAGRVLPLLLPRSRPPSADWRQPGGVAGRRPRHGRRRAGLARRAGRGVADHQHVPVADGRARQPDAGRGPVHAGGVSSGHVPARVPEGGRASSTSGPKSGSIARAARSSCRQIVGILARRIVCRLKDGDAGRARPAFWRDEVRVAHRSVSAAFRDASR